MTPYNIDAFLDAINQDPNDSNHRAVFADWLEDNDPHRASPEQLEFLRKHQGRGTVGVDPDTGYLIAHPSHVDPDHEDTFWLNGKPYRFELGPVDGDNQLGGNQWRNGTVVSDDGTSFDVGGGYLVDGEISPYDHHDQPMISKLAEHAGLRGRRDEDEVYRMLNDLTLNHHGRDPSEVSDVEFSSPDSEEDQGNYSADSMGYRQPTGYEDPYGDYEPEHLYDETPDFDDEDVEQMAPLFPSLDLPHTPTAQEEPPISRGGFGSTGARVGNSPTDPNEAWNKGFQRRADMASRRLSNLNAFRDQYGYSRYADDGMGMPTEYGDREAFEQSIDENPHEATTHGAYADWLDDNGEPEEAAFRRLIGDWHQNKNWAYHNHNDIPREARPAYSHSISLSHSSLPDGIGREFLPPSLVWGRDADFHDADQIRPRIIGGRYSWRTHGDMENALRHAFNASNESRRLEQQPPEQSSRYADMDNSGMGMEEDYARAGQPEVRQWAIQGAQGGSTDPNNNSDAVFADWLEDQDDPRHLIVRNDIGLRNRPERGWHEKTSNHLREMLGSEPVHETYWHTPLDGYLDGEHLQAKGIHGENGNQVIEVGWQPAGDNTVEDVDGSVMANGYQAFLHPHEFDGIMEGLGFPLRSAKILGSRPNPSSLFRGNIRIPEQEPEEEYARYADDGLTMPTEYGDRESLEAAIDANPIESTAHHVIADWFDENNQPDEAAFRRSMGDWVKKQYPSGKIPKKWNVFIGEWNYPKGVRHMGALTAARHPNDPHEDTSIPIQAGGRNNPVLSWPSYRDMEHGFRRTFMEGLRRQRAEQPPEQLSRYADDDVVRGGLGQVGNAVNRNALRHRELVADYDPGTDLTWNTNRVPSRQEIWEEAGPDQGGAPVGFLGQMEDADQRFMHAQDAPLFDLHDAVDLTRAMGYPDVADAAKPLQRRFGEKTTPSALDLEGSRADQMPPGVLADFLEDHADEFDPRLERLHDSPASSIEKLRRHWGWGKNMPRTSQTNLSRYADFMQDQDDELMQRDRPPTTYDPMPTEYWDEEERRGFEDFINQNPSDNSAKGPYADWLEERDLGNNPDYLEILRSSSDPLRVGRTPEGNLDIGFKKTVSPGVIDRRRVSAFPEVKLGRNLSISGAIGRDSFGQIGDSIDPERIKLDRGWTPEMLDRFKDVWRKHHLNDMKPGTPRQQEWIDQNPIEDRLNWYPTVLRGLSEAGLDPDPDTGHNFGHSWLRHDIPPDVIKFLHGLPSFKKKYSRYDDSDYDSYGADGPYGDDGGRRNGTTESDHEGWVDRDYYGGETRYGENEKSLILHPDVWELIQQHIQERNRSKPFDRNRSVVLADMLQDHGLDDIADVVRRSENHSLPGGRHAIDRGEVGVVGSPVDQTPLERHLINQKVGTRKIKGELTRTSGVHVPSEEWSGIDPEGNWTTGTTADIHSSDRVPFDVVRLRLDSPRGAKWMQFIAPPKEVRPDQDEPAEYASGSKMSGSVELMNSPNRDHRQQPVDPDGMETIRRGGLGRIGNINRNDPEYFPVLERNFTGRQGIEGIRNRPNEVLTGALVGNWLPGRSLELDDTGMSRHPASDAKDVFMAAYPNRRGEGDQSTDPYTIEELTSREGQMHPLILADWLDDNATMPQHHDHAKRLRDVFSSDALGRQLWTKDRSWLNQEPERLSRCDDETQYDDEFQPQSWEQQIHANPHDTNLRLAHADFLRDQGDDEGADFHQAMADWMENRELAQAPASHPWVIPGAFHEAVFPQGVEGFPFVDVDGHLRDQNGDWMGRRRPEPYHPQWSDDMGGQFRWRDYPSMEKSLREAFRAGRQNRTDSSRYADDSEPVRYDQTWTLERQLNYEASREDVWELVLSSDLVIPTMYATHYAPGQRFTPELLKSWGLDIDPSKITRGGRGLKLNREQMQKFLANQGKDKGRWGSSTDHILANAWSAGNSEGTRRASINLTPKDMLGLPQPSKPVNPKDWRPFPASSKTTQTNKLTGKPSQEGQKAFPFVPTAKLAKPVKPAKTQEPEITAENFDWSQLNGYEGDDEPVDYSQYRSTDESVSDAADELYNSGDTGNFLDTPSYHKALGHLNEDIEDRIGAPVNQVTRGGFGRSGRNMRHSVGRFTGYEDPNYDDWDDAIRDYDQNDRMDPMGPDDDQIWDDMNRYGGIWGSPFMGPASRKAFNVSSMPHRGMPPARYEGPTEYSTPTLRQMLNHLRRNPYDETGHGAFADALEEVHPDSPVPNLIRRQFGFGGEPRQNDWYDPVNNSWDGTFPGTEKIGSHGPFDFHLGHEGDRGSSNQRWIVHAVSNQPGSTDTGYTFEFPHEEAHVVSQLFPKSSWAIWPKTVDDMSPNDRVALPALRQDEANLFNDRMNAMQQIDEYDLEQEQMRNLADDPDNWEDEPEDYAAYSDDLSPEKAATILHDGEVYGHPLTDKQRRFMGWKSNQ